MNTSSSLDARSLAHRLNAVSHALHHRLFEQLRASDLDPRTVAILSVIDGRLDAPWVRDRIARGGKRVAALAERGWIARTDDTWTLTDEGRAILDRVDADRASILADLPADELAQLNTSLDAVADTLGVDPRGMDARGMDATGAGPRGFRSGRGGFGPGFGRGFGRGFGPSFGPGSGRGFGAGFGPGFRGRGEHAGFECGEGRERGRGHGHGHGHGEYAEFEHGERGHGGYAEFEHGERGHGEYAGFEHGEREHGGRGHGRNGAHGGFERGGRGRGAHHDSERRHGGSHRAHRAAQHAFERGFDAGFARGREASASGEPSASE